MKIQERMFNTEKCKYVNRYRCMLTLASITAMLWGI